MIRRHASYTLLTLAGLLFAAPAHALTTREKLEKWCTSSTGSVAGAGRCVLMGEAADSNLGCAGHNDAAVLAPVHYQRALKTPFEIAALRAATDLAVRGHRAARAAFLRGDSEYAINLAYLEASSQVGSDLPYGNIIALNEHADVHHYPP